MAQKFALIIGNSDYQDSALARLAMPEADVKGLAAVLRDPQIGGFAQVAPLVNRTAADVRLEVESFFADKSPDDLLLLYFTGHGVRDDQGQLYLAVNDTKHNRLRATAIPASYITGEMDRSRSRRQVLILDCCHSGSFAQGAKGVTGESVGTRSAFEGIGYGRVVLTATDATQYAWEGDQVIGDAQNSVFTLYLLQGLRSGEADANGDGKITLDELYDYVYEHVVTATPKQTPGKWSYKQQGEMVIANNPRPVTPKVELPVELTQAIESPFSAVREGAVRELERLLRGSNAGLTAAARTALEQLANDDSRRVASVASQMLQSYDSQVKAPAVQAAATHSAREQAEAEPAARQKAEQNRLARVPEQQERLTSEKAGAERIARDRAMQERLLEKTETEKSVMTSSGVAARFVQKFGGAILLTTAGWMISFALFGPGSSAASPSPFLSAILQGASGAFVMALALHWAYPAITWKHLGLIIVSWIVAEAGATLLGGYAGLVGFIVANAATGLALRAAFPQMQWRQVVIMAVGWFVGWLVALWFTITVHNVNDAVGGAIFGMVGAVVGSTIMFWQLAQVPETTPTAPVSETMWLPVALSAIGWAVAYLVVVFVSMAGLINYYGSNTELDLNGILKAMSDEASSSPVTHITKWAMIGVIVGGITALILRRRDAAIQRKQLFQVAIGWGIAYLVGIGLGGAISAIITSASEDSFDTLPWIILNVVSGMLGGFITGLALRASYPALQSKQVLVVALGWGIGYAISWVVVTDILAGRTHKVVEAFWLSGGVAGLVAGAIGSAVMYWQLNQLQRKT